MKIGRTLPPAAAPIPWPNILTACFSSFTTSQEPVAAFEEELKSYFNVKYCFLLSSGKAALTTILQSLHALTPDKNDVLIPAFTCYSVPAAIKQAGLHIKLCDLDPKTLDFDKNSLQKIADSDEARQKLLCVIPTHLFGLAADVEHCRQTFCSNIFILEDAAQTMGNEWKSKKLGTLGDVGFFSLGRGKALSTIEGGVVITNRDDIGQELFKQVSLLPEYTTAETIQFLATSLFTALFQHPSLFWLPKSLPFLRLGKTIYDPCFPIRHYTPAHATLARNWQARLAKHQNTRAKNARYCFDLIQNNLPQPFTIPWQIHDAPLTRLPILAASKEMRERILTVSTQKGLGVMPSYPGPINEIQEIHTDFSGESFPAAKKLSDRLLTLPTHTYTQKNDYKEIVTCLSTLQQW